MKKLLLGAILTLGYTFGAKAQVTILAQAFGTNSQPAGWTQTSPNVAGDTWEFNNAYGTNMGQYVATQGYCAYVDDWDNNPKQVTQNWDSLKSPVMNCASYAHVFISLNFMFWQDDGNETGTIAYSTNGGASWKTAFSLPNTSGGWDNGGIIDLSQYIGGKANAMIAFTYFNGCTNPAARYVAVGMCVQDVKVYAPLNYDVQVASQNLPFLMQVGTPYTFSGLDVNYGGDSVVSMNMNYSVNGGPAKTQTISGIAGFNALTTYNWSMPSVPFTPPSPGLYTVKFWANPLNGTYKNLNTDTLVASFWAIGTVVTRQALYEEFTGQSCVYCMLAAPNMDSVTANNASTSNIIRYHVPIPARDFMYTANETPVQARESYYGVNAAPFGNLDGTYFYPGGDYYTPATRYSSIAVQADNAVGSPISIKITKSRFVASKDSFEVSADITAHTALPAGLVAQVALTVDSLTYKYDLSMDNPESSFVFDGGNVPNRYYPYVLKFTHVAEEMFPNSGAGTTLGAFTANQTQTISFAWKKNHPWGTYDPQPRRDSDFYDSSSTGQFVVFVQANTAVPADAIPAKYVFQSASAPVSGFGGSGAAVESISNGVDFKMYPNPTNNNTTLAFNLDKDQNANIQVYNMLGEVVYSANEGMLSSGQHTIMINGSALNNGVYLVRLTTDSGITVQRLVIQK